MLTKILRPFILSLLTILPASAQDFTGAQYANALWMATRFYGGQRSGVGPNWLLMDSMFPQSFVKDSYNGQDISGGWFDCGDHVMFGQTQFYASYTLALAMTSFPEGWHDLYSADYSGYQAAGDYSISSGTPNGVPDILDELRYQADFIVKITPNASTFISQKGNGNYDHQRWVTAGMMATLDNTLGGEKSGSRDIVANPNDGNMPGQAAAMLAVMARHDPDAARRAVYLEHAIYAYQYAKTRTGLIGASPFYTANKEYIDARVNAATELWVTTGDNTYKTEALSWIDQLAFNGGWRLDYENDGALAIYNAEYVLQANNLNPSNWQQNLNNWLNSARSNVNPSQNNVSTWNEGGFPTRGPLGYAFVQALVNQASGNSQYDQFIFDQVDYVLGSNSQNHSYLFGFTENGKSNGNKPHHRNVYGNTLTGASPGDQNIPARNQFFGGLQGGKLDGSSNDDILDLSMNEPCIDLNATLVGALAYVVSKLAPNTQPIAVLPRERWTQKMNLEIRNRQIFLNFPTGHSQQVSIYDLSGRRVFRHLSDGQILNIDAAEWQSGVFQVVVEGMSARTIMLP